MLIFTFTEFPVVVVTYVSYSSTIDRFNLTNHLNHITIRILTSAHFAMHAPQKLCSQQPGTPTSCSINFLKHIGHFSDSSSLFVESEKSSCLKKQTNT